MVVDVLVVGGGPVGTTAALLLTQRGFSVRVLEKSLDVYDLPRAIAMDDEIQRVFQNAGLLSQLQAITTRQRGAEFVKPDGEQIIGVDLPMDGSWPLGLHPIVAFYQPELETFLRQAATDAGVDIQLGVEVKSVSQSATGVTATTDDGDHEARWLIAADGASSPTRKSLGIEFLDQGFDQGWLVIDTQLKRPVPTLPDYVQQVCDPQRPTTVVPGHADYRRWEFQLQPGETSEAMVEPSRVWELLEPWMTPDDADLLRAVVYRFHATVAASMRSGRIFIAGDAAHQMPPFLGQGLCSGIRDAANLAWKMRLVADGRANDAFLDTYSTERLPHAEATVAHAVATGRLIDELAGRPTSGPGLDAAYGGGRHNPQLTTGMLHGGHPFVGRQLPQPSMNGRPLDEFLGTGWAVIVAKPSTGDDLPESWGPLDCAIVEVPVQLFPGLLTENGAIVVRPDRYVAAVAANAEELRDAATALLKHLG